MIIKQAIKTSTSGDLSASRCFQRPHAHLQYGCGSVPGIQNDVPLGDGQVRPFSSNNRSPPHSRVNYATGGRHLHSGIRRRGIVEEPRCKGDLVRQEVSGRDSFPN